MARVCQLYPGKKGSSLVKEFFRFYDEYEWGVHKPVRLVADKDHPGTYGNLRFKQWKDTHTADELMPIITPAFPNMSTTFNVSTATMTLIEEEVHRAKLLIDRDALLQTAAAAAAPGSTATATGAGAASSSSSSSGPEPVLDGATDAAAVAGGGNSSSTADAATAGAGDESEE